MDPRFTDPGSYVNCSGTLVSPTIVLTAGHCTFGVGLNGEPTTASGGAGGDTRRRATVKLITLKGQGGAPAGTFATFSNNLGTVHRGATCFGDSGGPIFDAGTRIVVAVNSFVLSPNCTGLGGGYRVDQADDLVWLERRFGLAA